MAYVGKNISVAGFGAKGDFVMGDAHITNLIWRKQPQQHTHALDDFLLDLFASAVLQKSRMSLRFFARVRQA